MQCVKYRWGINGTFYSFNNDDDRATGVKDICKRFRTAFEFITVPRMLILKLFIGAKAGE